MVNNPSKIILLLILIAIISTVNISPDNSYNLADSKTIAYLAGLSYCPKKCLEDWSCQDGKHINMINVTHVNNPATLASGFVGYRPDKNQIVISFRGSSNIQNWIEDFNFQMVQYKCKGCFIHLGFLEDYKLIEGKVNQKVVSLMAKYPTATILATGHSLGGALSIIAALRIKEKVNRKVEVHNFGCPRVGNKPMSQYIHSQLENIYRVVHYKDLVPHLPFEWLDYHHTAYEVFFTQKMDSYQICNESGEDKNCSNKFYPEYNPSDHDFYFMAISGLKC